MVSSEYLKALDWLIVYLTTCQHRKVNLCQLSRKVAQAAMDGKRDTMHNTLRYTITT